MQILSIGEKIRKARISKKMTLKELCQKDISLSKMSNIENGKVKIKVGDELLSRISERLDMDIESFSKSTAEEANDKIKELAGKFSSRKYEEQFKNLLRLCINYDLKYEIFLARKQLVEYYIYKNKKDKISVAISKLYASLIKILNPDTLHIYFVTMGKYFIFIREYEKAIIFLTYLNDNYDKNPTKNLKNRKCEVLLYLSYALIYQNQIKEASVYVDILQKDLESNKNINPDLRLEINIMFYILRLLFKNDEIHIKKLSQNIIGTIEDSTENFLRVKYYLAHKKMENNDIKGAIDEISKFYKIFPKERYSLDIKIILKVMTDMIDKKEYKEASKYIDMVLNAAIESKSKNMIEKSYYYKAKIYWSEKDYENAEIYMWISIDLLKLTGMVDNISERYEELGNIYLKLNQKEKAIELFNLSNYNDIRFDIKRFR